MLKLEKRVRNHIRHRRLEEIEVVEKDDPTFCISTVRSSDGSIETSISLLDQDVYENASVKHIEKLIKALQIAAAVTKNFDHYWKK